MFSNFYTMYNIIHFNNLSVTYVVLFCLILFFLMEIETI